MANTTTFNQAGLTFDEVLYTFNGALYTPTNPAQEGRQIIYFDTVGQLLNVPFEIMNIVWVSNSAKPIVAGNTLLITDIDGNRIIGKDAESDGDGIEQPIFDGGVRVNGVRLDEMDGGVLYVFGERL